MKPFAERFYKSKTWERTRAAYASSKSGLCEMCSAKGDIVPGVIVHHIKPITPETINDPEFTLNWNNLQLLCRKHHAQAHSTNVRRYDIDEQGRVIFKEE